MVQRKKYDLTFWDQDLMKNQIFKYFIRSTVLLIISLIFKSFDTSFNSEIYPYFERSVAFSLIFIVFGTILWEGGVRLAEKIEVWQKSHFSKYNPIYLLGIGLVIYGMLSSLIMGYIQYIADTYIFGLSVFWVQYDGFNYDLNIGLFLFFLIILTFNATRYYYTNWQNTRLQTERLLRENIQSRYNALQQQIDPHFFFNSLSVLSNLVYKDPDLSANYINQLSLTYRYILDRKVENLVSLKTELKFVDSYLFLMKIRHLDSIFTSLEIENHVMEEYFVPPASLQLLLENAIKHNSFSINDPLYIKIYQDQNSITVENPVKKRMHRDPGTGLGLDNIKKRYELLGNQPVRILDDGKTFSVTLPLVKNTEANENIDN